MGLGASDAMDDETERPEITVATRALARGGLVDHVVVRQQTAAGAG
jgi:hypothetical protein